LTWATCVPRAENNADYGDPLLQTIRVKVKDDPFQVIAKFALRTWLPELDINAVATTILEAIAAR
jgi:hypothetical protein